VWRHATHPKAGPSVCVCVEKILREIHIVVTVNIVMQARVDRIQLRNPPWVPPWVQQLFPESCGETSEEERGDTRPSSRRRKRRRKERPVSESQLEENPAVCELADRVADRGGGGQGDSAAQERDCPSPGA